MHAIREFITTFKNRNIYVDKAHIDSELEALAQANGTAILTPVKKKRGQKLLDSVESLHSTTVSRIRQPIESLFNQIDEKVKLQNASKVRLLKGVLTYVWGKLAVFMLSFCNIITI